MGSEVSELSLFKERYRHDRLVGLGSSPLGFSLSCEAMELRELHREEVAVSKL